MATRPTPKLPKLSAPLILAVAGLAVILTGGLLAIFSLDNDGHSSGGRVMPEATVLCRARISPFSGADVTEIAMSSRPNGEMVNYISTGQVVEILEVVYSDGAVNAANPTIPTTLWYFGRLAGPPIQGWLPAAMTEPLTECPYPSTATTSTCTTPRLSAGSMGRVIGDGATPVNVKARFDMAAPSLQLLKVNTEFIVLAGSPVCFLGTYWYAIAIDGKAAGWIPETMQMIEGGEISVVYLIEPIAVNMPIMPPQIVNPAPEQSGSGVSQQMTPWDG